MGMFNVIDIKKNCPKCDSKVEWQTKDLVIDDRYLTENTGETYVLNRRMSAEIYTSCDKCKTWSELKIINGKLGKIKTSKIK